MQEILNASGGFWVIFLIYYLLTITIETPILCVGLSSQHVLSHRILAGVWLTACTYPIVFFVVPFWFHPSEDRLAYLAVAESVAHFGECVLFYLAFRPLDNPLRDLAAVFVANLASFAIGEWINVLIVDRMK